MRRFVVLAAACIIALAAPAQVWCQATCAAPDHDLTSSAVTPHCPSHDQSSGGSVTSTQPDQCRAPESSRSANPVRTFMLGSVAAIIGHVWSVLGVESIAASCASDSASPHVIFNHLTPLRI